MDSETPNAGAYLFLLLVSLSATGAGLYFFIRFLRRRQAIRDTPRSKIRSAAQGYVELHGVAQPCPSGPLVSDLAGQSCVWFRFAIEKRDRGSKHEWSTIERYQSEQPFMIADDTGECVIDPAGATVFAVYGDQWYGNEKRPDRSPDEPAGWWRQLIGFRYRYTEARIEPTDPIYVIGELKTASPIDAVTEPVETMTAGAPSGLNAGSRPDGASESRSPVAVVTTIARPALRSQPFVISAEGEGELLRKQRTKIIAAAVLFVAGLLGAAIVVMVARVA